MRPINFRWTIITLFVIGMASLAAGCGQSGGWDTTAKGTPVPTPPLVLAAVKAARTGDMTDLRPHLTTAMAGDLTPNNIAAVKDGLDSLGTVQSIKTWRQPPRDGLTAYRFLVSLQHGNAVGFLAEDSSGQIAGLRFEPAATQSWDRTGKGTAVATPAVVTKVVDATLAGNYPAMKPMLAADMSDVVTPASMAQMKTRLHYMGALESVTTLRQDAPANITDYHFTLHMSRGPEEGFLAENSQGQIVGLRMAPGELSPKQIFSVAFSR